MVPRRYDASVAGRSRSAWIGWGLRHDRGWAITPGGVVLPDRTVRWGDVGWFGLVVDDRREDGRVRQRWQLALRDDHHGLVEVGPAFRPDPERVADLSRTVAAAWLVGAPPRDVPFVLAPPGEDRQGPRPPARPPPLPPPQVRLA